ncbi:MAG: lipoyl(octanoyl) transferase LipB [Candidatus Brocadiae bacterium]|nr:lipoyl(octanoyl) transferase LipB [Candidatus Brocadiia bacterium]
MAHPARPQLLYAGLRRLDFHEAFRLQERLRDACIASQGRPNYLLLVEHPPTVTVGRKGSRADVLVSDEKLSELGVCLIETNRGGEVTYHGPGQLVVYPIVNLAQRGCDLHRYLRDLERWLVGLCRSYNVAAHAGPPHTGVWVGERKIASIGIAVRRWVSYHGVAFNVATDLSQFDLIVPCGLPGMTVTSLARELGTAPDLEEVAERAAGLFAEEFAMRLERVPAEAVETA